MRDMTLSAATSVRTRLSWFLWAASSRSWTSCDAERRLALVAAELLRIVASWPDRKSTRLNSSHSQISYAVFCLKKKKHLAYFPRLARCGPIVQFHVRVCASPLAPRALRPPPPRLLARPPCVPPRRSASHPSALP